MYNRPQCWFTVSTGVHVVLSIQEEVGDVVLYLEKRPAAELLAAIWYTYRRKYKKSLPVTISSEIQFKRQGISAGVLKCGGGPAGAKPGFNKTGAQSAVLV